MDSYQKSSPSFRTRARSRTIETPQEITLSSDSDSESEPEHVLVDVDGNIPETNFVSRSQRRSCRGRDHTTSSQDEFVSARTVKEEKHASPSASSSNNQARTRGSGGGGIAIGTSTNSIMSPPNTILTNQIKFSQQPEITPSLTPTPSRVSTLTSSLDVMDPFLNLRQHHLQLQESEKQSKLQVQEKDAQLKAAQAEIAQLKQALEGRGIPIPSPQHPKHDARLLSEAEAKLNAAVAEIQKLSRSLSQSELTSKRQAALINSQEQQIRDLETKTAAILQTSREQLIGFWNQISKLLTETDLDNRENGLNGAHEVQHLTETVGSMESKWEDDMRECAQANEKLKHAVTSSGDLLYEIMRRMGINSDLPASPARDRE